MAQTEFDIILLGATGYTGSICAEHIALNFPTTLPWAIAGRSSNSLEALASRLKQLNPDRLPPTVIPTQIDQNELHTLVRRGRVVINAVGPYHLHSEPVVEACVAEGTHYVDFSTETPWIADMVSRYHDMAKKSGAIVIHAASNSSAPPDLLAWLIASKIKENTGMPAKEIITSGKLTMAGMGGGSATTVLSTVQNYGIGWMLNPDPFSMLPKTATKQRHAGLPKGAKHAELGYLTTSLVGVSNSAIVRRSAYLQPEVYAENFTHQEYLPSTGIIAVFLTTVLTKVLILMLALSPIRALVRKMSYEPGSGPDWRKNAKLERVDFDAVGEGANGSKVRGKFIWEGAIVHVSAILVAEAAAVLVDMNKEAADAGKGGMRTPSCLGTRLVEKLEARGCKFDVETL